MDITMLVLEHLSATTFYTKIEITVLRGITATERYVHVYVDLSSALLPVLHFKFIIKTCIGEEEMIMQNNT